jgi:hypothetical protein
LPGNSGYFFHPCILVLSVEKQAPDTADVGAADIGPRVRISGQKFLDVKRGVLEPFCHEDFRSIRINRETLLRCRGSTSRV